ncbi:MAG: serine/threonine protein kinase, partial [bacterium]|nr:serine/threonine protein kinase [bacterium]
MTRTRTLAPSHLEQAREDLAALSRRLARGELDEASYQRQRRLILSHLSPGEQEELGPTPTPATSSGIILLGPSGGLGGAHRTSVPTPNGPAAGPVDAAAVPTLADLDLKPGTILFDQWQIVRETGRGGFGAVFEAEELNLGETQAVKVLAPSMVAQDALLARFRREVTLMRKLVHPHIGRVYDYREDLGQHLALISMEFIAGGTVRDLNAFAGEWKKSIPLPLALAILTQTLEALAAAHAQGVIHRDVKPGNILLAGGTPEEFFLDPLRDPGVKLIDFGIAGQVECPEPSDRSLVLGTVAYVAPELVGSSAEVTQGADVYGAGAVAYELVTGELPLGRFDAPSELREGLPEGLEEMLLALLSRRLKERPAAPAVVG